MGYPTGRGGVLASNQLALCNAMCLPGRGSAILSAFGTQGVLQSKGHVGSGIALFLFVAKTGHLFACQQRAAICQRHIEQ